MSSRRSTYDECMQMAAFYAEQADAYRVSLATLGIDSLTRRRFIRDKQDVVAMWVKAAQRIQVVP
jgi:hypothetical protein